VVLWGVEEDFVGGGGFLGWVGLGVGGLFFSNREGNAQSKKGGEKGSH